MSESFAFKWNEHIIIFPTNYDLHFSPKSKTRTFGIESLFIWYAAILNFLDFHNGGCSTVVRGLPNRSWVQILQSAELFSALSFNSNFPVSIMMSL